MGRAYRTGILPGFLFGLVLSAGLRLTVDSISGGEWPWVVAIILVGSTLWLGPAFSELYARVFVVHYPDRSFPTFAGTLTFWVAIVLSLVAIVFLDTHVKAVVALNVLATALLGYLIPVAYHRGWGAGRESQIGAR